MPNLSSAEEWGNTLPEIISGFSEMEDENVDNILQTLEAMRRLQEVPKEAWGDKEYDASHRFSVWEKNFENLINKGELDPRFKIVQDKLLQMSSEDIGDLKEQREEAKIFEKIVGPLRNVGQGLLLGHGDEIEASIRSALGPRGYDEVRNEIRGKIKSYKKKYPTESVITEVTGAILPFLLSFLGGPAGGAAGATNMGRVLASGGKAALAKGALKGSAIGATEGALSGVGYSEKEGSELFGPAMTGAGIGAGIGGAIGSAIPAIQGAGNGVIGWVKRKMGATSERAVRNELTRLVGLTGKNMDEIITDIASGRTLSDNQTLNVAIKGYSNAGGESGKMLRELAGKRARGKSAQAMESLQEKMAPDTKEDILRAWKQGDEAATAAEHQAYEAVLGSENPAPASVVEKLQDTMQRFPSVRNELQRNYVEKNLGSLFVKGKGGQIELVRQPTLRDAEEARRVLQEEGFRLSKAGKGTRAKNYRDAEEQLRMKLDQASEPLQKIRQEASELRSAREAFKAGRNYSVKDIGELDMLVEKYEQQSPEIARAFRVGAMNTLRNKVRNTQRMLTKLANEEHNEGLALRTILPKEGRENVLSQLETAAQAKELSDIMPVSHGSPTAQLLTEQAARGGSNWVSELKDIATGDFGSAIRSVLRRMEIKNPDLTEQDRSAIIQALFSQDEDYIRKLLTNESSLEQFLTGTILKEMQSAAQLSTIEQLAK